MRVDNTALIRHTEDVELMREIFLELCARDDRILTVPKPIMRISEFTKSGIKVSFRPWVRQVHYWDVWFEFRGLLLFVVFFKSIFSFLYLFSFQRYD